MNIRSTGASDNASDFMVNIANDIRLKVTDHMGHMDNEYNTPGFIDCTLVLKSLINKENEFYFTCSEGWLSMWSKLDTLFCNNAENFTNMQNDYDTLHKFVKYMKDVTYC